MIRVALREIRSHWVRFALSILAVVLGVAFVAGTYSLREMLSNTFENIVSSAVQGDVYLRGAGSDEPGGVSLAGDDGRDLIGLDLVDEVDELPGVAAVIPAMQGSVVVVGADGQAVINGQAPSFGIALYPDDPSVRIVEGRAPEAADEIALDSSAMESSGLAVGDTTSLVIESPIDVTVVGETAFDASPAGATLVFLSVEQAEAVFAPNGQVTQIALYVADGSTVADVEAVLADTDAVTDAGVEVISGDDLRTETSETINQLIGFIGTFLLVFAVLALFVGAFIISNTFAMSVRQRQREYALLRAIGASPTQVFAIVVGQAVVVGLLGSALGYAAGLGLVELLRIGLDAIGMELGSPPGPDPAVLAACLGAGTLVSVVAAIVPARAAALTAPVEAMRDDVAVTERSLRGRALVGAVLLTVGVGSALYSVFGQTTEREIWLAVGAGGVLLGTLAIAPVIARAVLGVLAWPLVVAVRPLGRLARGNVTRNPRRTASTAGALMIGMALVAACTVLAASATSSVSAVVDGETRADLVVQSASRTVPAQAAAAVAEVDSTSRVDSLRFGGADVSSRDVDPYTTTAASVPPDALGATLQVRALEGSMGSLAGGDIAVSVAAARENDWQVGEEVTISGDIGELTAPIGAITDSQLLGFDVVLPADLFDEVVPSDQASTIMVLVEAASGVDVADLQAAVSTALESFIVVSALSTEELTDQLADQVEQALVIIYALLGLSIVIAIMGIVNTLALSVVERTREIGLVRAVGLGRFQLSMTIVLESVLTAVFGTALGLVVGVGLAAALRSVFQDQGLTVLTVPFDQLGLILVLSVIVGVLAAVWPAIRASRLPVLDAIALA